VPNAPRVAKMTDTRVFKVFFMFDAGDAATCSAIEYKGAIWLVTKWLPFHAEGYTKPERMIRLDQFQHERFDPPATNPGPLQGTDFGIRDPVPKALFLGDLTDKLKAQYVVLERPDVKLRVGGVRH